MIRGAKTGVILGLSETGSFEVHPQTWFKMVQSDFQKYIFGGSRLVMAPPWVKVLPRLRSSTCGCVSVVLAWFLWFRMFQGQCR